MALSNFLVKSLYPHVLAQSAPRTQRHQKNPGMDEDVLKLYALGDLRGDVSKHESRGRRIKEKTTPQPPTPALPHPGIHFSVMSNPLHLPGCHHRSGRMSSPVGLCLLLHLPSLLSRLLASACSLFVFKSPFWQSDMSAVFGSSAVTFTGIEVGPVTAFRGS